MPRRRITFASTALEWAFHPEDGGGRLLAFCAGAAVLLIVPVWATGCMLILVTDRAELLAEFNIGAIAFLAVVFVAGLFAARRVHKVRATLVGAKTRLDIRAGADSGTIGAADRRVLDALSSLDFDQVAVGHREPPVLTGEIPILRQDGREG